MLAIQNTKGEWFQGAHNRWGSAVKRSTYRDMVSLPKTVSTMTMIDITVKDGDTVMVYRRVSKERELYANVVEVKKGNVKSVWLSRGTK